jgi:hypothetical protein
MSGWPSDLLHGDPTMSESGKLLCKNLSDCGRVAIFKHIAFLIENEEGLEFFSEVECVGNCAVAKFGGFRLFAPSIMNIFWSSLRGIQRILEQLAFSS